MISQFGIIHDYDEIAKAELPGAVLKPLKSLKTGVKGFKGGLKGTSFGGSAGGTSGSLGHFGGTKIRSGIKSPAFKPAAYAAGAGAAGGAGVAGGIAVAHHDKKKF